MAQHVVYIQHGVVKTYLQDVSRNINLDIAVGGDFLTMSAVFGDKTYNYSAIAIEPTSICMIDKVSMKLILLKHPEMAFELVSQTYRREKLLLEKINTLATKQMRGKLASALLYLLDAKFADLQLFSYLNRQDIADFAGITTESTIRFLKEFETDSIIAMSNKQIQIVNKSKLEEIYKLG